VVQKLDNFGALWLLTNECVQKGDRHLSEYLLCVKLHLRDERTDRGTDYKTRLFVSCICQSVHPMGERTAMLHRNLRGGGKHPGSTNKYTKYDHFIWQQNY